jgi:hypothetical protein
LLKTGFLRQIRELKNPGQCFTSEEEYAEVYAL